MSRRLRIIAFFVALCVFLQTLGQCSFAGDDNYHSKQLDYMLFGTGFSRRTLSADEKDKLTNLEDASHLTIDQMHGELQGVLDDLKEDISAIKVNSVKADDFNIPDAGEKHRGPSHLGWETAFYSGDKNQERWNNRRNVLLETVSDIFGFKKTKGEYSAQCEHFCALIYYLHILGDRVTDSKYYPASVLMDIGGRKDENDILTQVKIHFEALFIDQKKSADYHLVSSKLSSYERDMKKLNIAQNLPTNATVDNNEVYKEYVKYGNEALSLLEERIPRLLKNEEFITNVFS